MIYHFNMTYKCYEYYTKGGIAVTDWFPWSSSEKPQWQLKNKLRNFYKDETRDIPSDLLQGL